MSMNRTLQAILSNGYKRYLFSGFFHNLVYSL